MIENLFLFEGLSESQKEQVISLLNEPVSFEKGEIIYSADTYKGAIGIIIEGAASAIADNNQGLFKKSFSKGNVFGAAAIFGSNGAYVSKIIAESKTKVLFIDEATLTEIFKIFPGTALNYISFLSEKIRFLNQKLNMISCTNAEDTVYNDLIQNMNSENTVNLPVSMTLLARMLGVGRATLYRSFDALENKGKIKRENNIIKVI